MDKTNKILSFLKQLRVIKLKADVESPDFVVLCPKCRNYRQEGIGQIWVTTWWSEGDKVGEQAEWKQEDSVFYKCNLCGYSKKVEMPLYG